MQPIHHMNFFTPYFLLLFLLSCTKIFAQCHAAFSYRAITSNTLQFSHTRISGLDSTATFLWTFGDGYGAKEENPMYTFPDTGWFNVSLQIHVGSRGCSSDTCAQVHVVNCQAYFTSLYQPTVEQPEVSAYYFADQSQGEDNTTVYSWLVGGGDLSSHKNLAWTFHIDDAGVQPVCFTIRNTDNSCVNTYCDSFDIHPLCQADSFTYTRRGTACTFYPWTCGRFNKVIWDFGDGTVDSAKVIADSVAHNYPSATGTYQVCLTTLYDSVCNFRAPCTAIFCHAILPKATGKPVKE